MHKHKCSGTSGYEFKSFRDGVYIVNCSYAEARFTCKWPNSFQPTQNQFYKM